MLRDEVSGCRAIACVAAVAVLGVRSDSGQPPGVAPGAGGVREEVRAQTFWLVDSLGTRQAVWTSVQNPPALFVGKTLGPNSVTVQGGKDTAAVAVFRTRPSKFAQVGASVDEQMSGFTIEPRSRDRSLRWQVPLDGTSAQLESVDVAVGVGVTLGSGRAGPLIGVMDGKVIWSVRAGRFDLREDDHE